jgi:hypothetical protein
MDAGGQIACGALIQIKHPEAAGRPVHLTPP